MKLNSLKHELDKWKRAVSEPAPVKPTAERATPIQPCVRPAEKVVGGVVKWKPVDRAAAMLLAKANWLSLPPWEPPKKVEPKKRTKMPRSQIEEMRYANNPAVDTGKQEIHVKTDAETSDEIHSKVIQMTRSSIDGSIKLVEQAADARAALDTMADTWRKDWFDFMQTNNSRVTELRQFRMATETEMRQLMASLREVRMFFLDKDYATEIARLKEFVEVCERLQKLKTNGFLDSMADTMLKLDIGKDGA